MYNDIYRSQPAQVSVVQILMTVAIVFVSLVLPIYYITSSKTTTTATAPYTAASIATRAQSDTQSTGQVAGAATVAGVSDTQEELIFIPVVNAYLNLESEAGLLTIAGVLLLGIAALLVIYLILV